MPRRPLASSVMVAVLGASPAAAQHPWENAATVEQAIARAVEEAMPGTTYPWSLDWNAFGVRGGRDIFWHLNPPQPNLRHALPEGVHHRTGWLSVNGRSGSVTVCGDADRVGMMTIEVNDIWLGQSDVIAELEARGVAAVLVSEIPVRPELGTLHEEFEPSPHYDAMVRRFPALRTWRLTKAGLEPVDLTATRRCTPPGTRSATQCWMKWSVLFRPDERDASAEPCLPPARPEDDG